jgi:hypothetical protein
MIERFRTRLATLIVNRLTRSRPLVVPTWLWLAAEADDLEEKRCCLNAVLELDSDRTSGVLWILPPRVAAAVVSVVIAV